MAGINLNTAHVLRAMNANGAAVSGAQLYVYQAGTTTPVTTYSDEALTTPNSHPIIADASGAWGDVYLSPQSVKVDVQSSAGVSLPGYPIDDIRVGDITEMFDTRTQLSSATVQSTVKWARTNGYAAIGDGGRGFYKRVVSEPSHAAKVRSVDRFLPDGTTDATNGGWWELVPEGGRIDVRQLGAAGDFAAAGSGTDDTTAINNAFAAADAMRKSVPNVLGGSSSAGGGAPAVYFPHAAGYRITAAVSCGNEIDVIMDAPIVVDSATAFIGLTIGETAVRSHRAKHKVMVRRAQQLAAVDSGDIGVKFVNPYWNDIELVEVRDFSTGAMYEGIDLGAVYNKTQLGILANCNKGLVLKGTNSAGTGWCNENVFLGGSWLGVIADASNEAFGIHIWNDSNDVGNSDNNLFIKPSFELNPATGDTAYCFLIEDGRGTKAQQMRFENGGLGTMKVAKVTGTSRSNDFEMAAGGDTLPNSALDDTSSVGTSFVRNQQFNYADLGKPVFVMERLLGRTCYYDGGTNVHTAHCEYTAGTVVLGKSGSSITIGTRGLTMPSTRGVGRRIDTSRLKQFVVHAIADGSVVYFVRCYDAAGAVLSAASATTYAWGTPTLTQFPAGEAYTTSSLARPLMLNLHADVKSAGIYVGGATNLQGFSIHAIEKLDGQYVGSWVDYEEIQPGANIGTTAPTAGTWRRGKIVLNDAPSVDGNNMIISHWVCTVAGTPGTWQPCRVSTVSPAT